MSTMGLISFLIAISLSMMLIPLLVRVAPSIGLVDLPGPRKIHTNVVPRVGGIAIFLSSIIPLLIWLPKTQLFYALLTALLVLFLFGVWDDKSDIDFRVKFFGQIAAAAILVYWGDIYIHQFPFFEDNEIPQGLTRLFTVFLLVGVTNAVNMADGLDGLAGGTSLLAVGCMTVTAYLAQDVHVVVFGLALIGAILGFLRFNTYPAQVFMGDVGSLALGGALGTVAIITKHEILLAIVGGVFVVEALSVILQVTSYKLRKKRIFAMAPLHHHYELKGWAEPKIIVRFWIVAAFLALVAISTLKLR